jgi:HPt (histidine-containing phosphotransfer) domain-containing protein
LGGSVELLQQLVILYSEDAPQLLGELRDGAARGDLERLKRAAHTLKGLAANFEATPAAQAAFRVEQLAQANDLAAAIEQLPAMEAEFDKLQRALDRQIASPS